MLYRFDRRAAAGTLWFLLAFALAPSASASSPSRATTIKAVAVEHPPSPAGDVTDPVWKTGIVADGFTDFTTRRPAPLATTAYVLYDAKALYVGFVCDQAGVPLVATNTTNNVGFGVDDSVQILIDTSGMGNRVYTFATTPKGIRYQTSSESTRYNPVWSAFAQPTPDGWTAQMVIPLDVLRAEGGSVQSWRINAIRHVGAANEDYTWAYDATATSPTDATYWPTVTGIAVAKRATRPKPRADAYALGTAGADRRQFQTGFGTFAAQQPRNAGVDVNVPFTNTLAFVGTLNPDFSNVEVDQQTIAPQEFRRSLNEYRPFFAQGANYLDPVPGKVGINGIPDTPFYTPSIGTFDRGFKVEGTARTQSIGALDVRGPGFDDQAFGYAIGTPNQSLKLGASAVLVHHDVGNDITQSIGVSRSNVHSGEASFISMKTERGTLVTEPARAHEFSIGEILQTQRYLAIATYQDVGPQYNPVDGYTRINDARGPLGLLQFNGVGRGAVKSYSAFAFGDRYIDRSGAVHAADVSASASVTFKNLLTLSGGPSTSELRVYDQAYPVYAQPQTFRFNSHNLGLGYRDGTPGPIDASLSWGPFAAVCFGVQPQPAFCGNAPGLIQAYTHQFTLSAARPFGPYALSVEYDGTRERPYAGTADGQFLRRVSLTRSIGRDTSLSVAVRDISGTGGYAAPGVNVAASLHAKFRNQSELYVNFGTPSSTRTLDRLVLKYVFHLGGGAGT
ncbi:MAG: hypothetical protein NVS3B7_08440 [Candidatus Elarobacter sp.]